MKVSKCPVANSVVLTLDEIKKNEGVYRFKSKTSTRKDGFDTEYPGFRIIVITDSAKGDAASVLYYNGESLVSADGSWNQYLFEKTAETVCFALKKD